ncbi:MAG: hypothetical protein H6Q37_214 [Chloroflexi bacterium]|nr:hypothetical protein [Chloroflexota bacterium]
MKKKWVIWILLFGVVLLSLAVLAACGGSTPAATTGEQAAGEECTEIPKPTNAGSPGAAVGLTGDPTAGETVFSANCTVCHGDQGKGGVDNPGSDDGTVPELNPVDACLKSTDATVFATNLDLFIEYGNVPEGENPAKQMPAFGKAGTLTQEQIADVIAYVMSLNK